MLFQWLTFEWKEKEKFIFKSKYTNKVHLQLNRKWVNTRTARHSGLKELKTLCLLVVQLNHFYIVNLLFVADFFITTYTMIAMIINTTNPPHPTTTYTVGKSKWKHLVSVTYKTFLQANVVNL